MAASRARTRSDDAPSRPALVRLARRASWNLIDQVLSAGTNAALTFIVARETDAAGFGAFAVAFLGFSLLVGVERSLVGQPMSIRHSGGDEAAWRDATARGLGTVVAVTLPFAVLAVGAGVLVGGVLGPTLVALGAVLPALTLQDACRLVFFSRSRPKLAAANDGLWAVLQFAAVAVLMATDQVAPWQLVLAWGGSAAVCVVMALRQLGVRVRVSVSAAGSWVGEHRDLVGYLLAEYLLGTGAYQGGVLLIGGLIGIGDIGSLRAAQVLLGPLGIVATSLMTFGLPEVSRRTSLGARARSRIATTVSVGMVAGSLAYAGLMLLIPDTLGTALLGDTWSGAQHVLLPMALGSTSAGACLGPAIVIFAMGMARTTFRLTTISAPLIVVLLLAGAGLDGARGAAWGFCLAQTAMIPLWFARLRALLRTGARRRAGDAVEQPATA